MVKQNMVKQNLTGANYGINSWLYQRLTAIIMLIFGISFLGFIFVSAYTVNSSLSSWQNLCSYTIVRILIEIFFVAVIIHAWVGIRDIWMDYIKCNILRLTLHTFTVLWLLGSFIYSIKVIF